MVKSSLQKKKKKKKILVYTELPRSAPEESFFGNRYRLKFIMRTSTFFVSEDYMIYGNPRSSHKVDVNDRIMFLSIVEGVFRDVEMEKWDQLTVEINHHLKNKNVGGKDVILFF